MGGPYRLLTYCNNAANSSNAAAPGTGAQNSVAIFQKILVQQNLQIQNLMRCVIPNQGLSKYDYMYTRISITQKHNSKNNWGMTDNMSLNKRHNNKMYTCERQPKSNIFLVPRVGAKQK